MCISRSMLVLHFEVVLGFVCGVALCLDALHYDTFNIPSRTCEPITVDMCKGNGYNNTGGPNFLDDEFFNQADLARQLSTFKPLIKTGCSKQLQSFLCTAYIPMCDPQVEQVIGPCRSVCENVKMRCQPILKKVSIPWPAALNCSIFPESNTAEHMCMPLPIEDDDPLTTTSPTPPSSSPKSAVSKIPPCLTKLKPTAYKLINSTGECQARCDMDVKFTHSQKHFTEIWMAVWTSFSLLFSLLTVITFFIGTSQFPYPKRPIVFLSLSYTLYTVGYLVRLTAGRHLILCDPDKLITQGLDNANCTAVFLLLYYFSTAAAIWWIVFSLAWLLSVGLRWSHEAIDLYSSYFHLFAWGVPAVQSIVIIVLREVSGEELTGLCLVSTENPSSLLGFVIAPLAVYLLLGTALLVAGYIISFCHDRKQMKKSDEETEALMVRVGIFGLFYTVPTTCLLACYFYEYLNANSWGNVQTDSSPSVEIYALKTLASLLPGIASGLCILNCKNFDTWSTVCGRPCLKRYASSSKSIYHCGSSVNSNNNNNTRYYTPVKSISVRQGRSSSPSHYSSSLSRGHELKHHHQIYMTPPQGSSIRYPNEYHV